MSKLEALLARRAAIGRSGSRVLGALRRGGDTIRCKAESVADLVHQRSLLGNHDQEGWQQGQEKATHLHYVIGAIRFRNLPEGNETRAGLSPRIP